MTRHGFESTLSRRQLLTRSLRGLAAVSLGAGVLPAFSRGAEPVVDYERQLRLNAEQAELSLLFRGSSDAEAEAWRNTFRMKLVEMVGDTTPPDRWETIEENRTEQDDYVRYELLLTAPKRAALPVYLLLPKSASKERPVPGVVCLHGHGDHGHHPIVGRTDLPGVERSIAGANYDYGLQFVRRGYAVAAPCLLPFGRRLDRATYQKEDPCGITFMRMQALGEVLIGSNIRDIRWALNLLQSRPEVKGDRLGCAGLSYGGRMTMMASALDERIRVAAVSGALNLLQERISGRYSCGAQIVPGLLKYGDYSEIGSLIAPRPCVWETGSADGLIKPDWARIFRERLERIYAAFGAADALKFDEFEGGHRWNGGVAFPLFERTLLG